MDPQMTAPAPAPTSNYDFILNPAKPPKRTVLGGNSFVAKIAFLVGGAVAVMIVLALIVNLVFGSKTSVDTVIALTQTEQEVVRLGSLGDDSTDQSAKNAAINTALTVKTHQLAWLTYLAKHGKKLNDKQLALKKDLATDRKLKLAQQTSTFDPTYISVMRAQLTAYANDIKTAYKGTTNKQEKTLLNQQYGDVVLLLKQWPSS